MNEVIEKLQNLYKDKKVLVVGLGLQGGGAGVAKFFAELGALVTITDKKSEQELTSSIEQLKQYEIKYVLGRHELNDFLEADLIIKGPSVPWTMPEIEAAQQKGVVVDMEVSFFAEHTPSKIIGVTGTRGKSTTSQMIYECLKQSGKKTQLAGNVPQTSTINILHTATPDEITVLELSSWSLSGFHRKKLSPHIAVFTNFYPDHLNYYKSMEDYYYDKSAIYRYQHEDDYLVAYHDLKQKIETDNPTSKVIYFNAFDEQLEFLKGIHNEYNAGAAFEVGKLVGLEETQLRKSLTEFKGLPYRQEIIAEVDKIVYINDTTSTTPVAAQKAIETFADGHILLILGGNAKGLPFEDLLKTLISVEQLILLDGTFTQEILPKLKEKFSAKLSPVFKTIDEAVRFAANYAKTLDGRTYVLFSPGATSFAMFKNEFDRGDAFNKVVREITQSNGS